MDLDKKEDVPGIIEWFRTKNESVRGILQGDLDKKEGVPCILKGIRTKNEGVPG